MLRKYKYSPHPDMVTWKTEFVPDTIVGVKARKTDTLEQAVVTVGDIAFDADEQSMNRIARVIASANALMMQDIAGGQNPADSATTRLAETISWKCADDVVRNVSVSTLVSVLEQAKNNMTSVWVA